MIPKPHGNGWYLYYEQYPGVSYGCSSARTLAGPWYEIYWHDFDVPQGARHGCMISLTAVHYDAILAAYGSK